MATAAITAATVTGTVQRTTVQSVSEKLFKGWGAEDFRPRRMGTGRTGAGGYALGKPGVNSPSRPVSPRPGRAERPRFREPRPLGIVPILTCRFRGEAAWIFPFIHASEIA